MKFPMIIDQNNYRGDIVFQNLKKNESFNLGEKLKTKTYSNYRLIYIVNDRNDVDNEFKYGKVFSTTDQALIEDFLTTEFTYTGSDVATVQMKYCYIKIINVFLELQLLQMVKVKGCRVLISDGLNLKKTKEFLKF